MGVQGFHVHVARLLKKIGDLLKFFKLFRSLESRLSARQTVLKVDEDAELA